MNTLCKNLPCHANKYCVRVSRACAGVAIEIRYCGGCETLITQSKGCVERKTLTIAGPLLQYQKGYLNADLFIVATPKVYERLAKSDHH